MKQVDIVIVNWNTGGLLKKCLQAIAVLPPDEQRLINAVAVVDNNSTDNSFALAQQVRLNVPVEFVDAGTNLGFAGANNLGVSHVQGDGSRRHIFLLNPDTEVKPGSIAVLLDTIETNQKVAAVGPQLIGSDGQIQPSVRQFPSLGLFVFLFLKLRYLLPESRVWQEYIMKSFNYHTSGEVDQVMGAALLMNADAVDDIGLLDERFWIWFEEVDWCRRAKDKGWRIVYTPRATVLHHGGVSFSQLVGYKKSLPFFNSAIKYSAKHLGLVSTGLLVVLLPLALLLVLPAGLVHFLARKKKRKLLEVN